MFFKFFSLNGLVIGLKAFFSFCAILPNFGMKASTKPATSPNNHIKNMNPKITRTIIPTPFTITFAANFSVGVFISKCCITYTYIFVVKVVVVKVVVVKVVVVNFVKMCKFCLN